MLVLGATGNGGRMAVQVARHLGAGRVVVAGRDLDRLAALAELGADGFAPLGSAEFGGPAGPLDGSCSFREVARGPGSIRYWVPSLRS